MALKTDRKNSSFSLPGYDHHHMDNFINDARKYSNLNEKTASETIRALTAALEHLLEQQKNLNVSKEDNYLTVKSVAQFNSMIQAEEPEKTEETKLEDISPEEMAPIHDPRWVKSIPNCLMIINAIVYMAIGAYIFQLLDEKIAQMPYYKALLFAFQITCTIGWGNPYVMSYTGSKAFCTVYTMFGVPLVFAAFSNVGREATELYCREWPFLKNLQKKLRKKISDKTDDRITRLPLKAGFLFLVLHQIWGIILFNYWLHEFGIIETVYFSIVSISTTGLGDFKPNPTSMFQAIIVIFYLCVGITILSAIYASLAYYWQRFHFVTIKSYMVELGKKIFIKHKHKIKPILSKGNGQNGNLHTE